jgi:hypothetical protein
VQFAYTAEKVMKLFDQDEIFLLNTVLFVVLVELLKETESMKEREREREREYMCVCAQFGQENLLH